MVIPLLKICMLVAGHAAAQSKDIIKPADKVYEFVNGKWFDGKSFVTKHFYTQNGILRSSRPARIDSIVDLSGKYVIPPPSPTSLLPYIMH
jgi:hypothetical protein